MPGVSGVGVPDPKLIPVVNTGWLAGGTSIVGGVGVGVGVGVTGVVGVGVGSGEGVGVGLSGFPQPASASRSTPASTNPVIFLYVVIFLDF